MNPNSLVHLRKLLLPSSRSHWSATEPRSKTQPTASTHTQRNHTRHGCWQPKPVRPVSETGQTASVGLSLTQAGKPVRPVRQTGQTDSVQKLPKDPKHLKSLSTSEQTKSWSSKDFLAQKPFSTAHRAKPVRPVRETGQTGFSLDSREEHSPRVNSSKTKPRSPEPLHGLEQDFGDIRNTS
jgi:hypothetical protein